MIYAVAERLIRRLGIPSQTSSTTVRVSLTIDTKSAAAAQADTAVGVMNLAEMEQTFADAHRKYPDLPDKKGWSVQPLGGVGLYVSNGSLAVRSFCVTPLPSAE